MINRPSAVLATLVGVVAILAVAAAVVVANRDAPALDAASPEGVVQTYLEAVLAGDDDEAFDLVSSTAGCDASDVSTAYLPDTLRVVVLGTEVDGDEAVVRVDVTENPGNGLFEDSGWSHEERFSLRRTGGVWQIEASPWLLFGCTGEK
ncbi:hypothetical protein [Cellulomonas sp. KRMCY2]|uniref:hypothetical protein n=1 Tax=Cellulomonas sp. KRMCY2 TaxID=1304865 RepID=UPI00045E9190|nr:hypothetical protein [Cellulomonas sp. KRMCY2]